MNNNSIHEKYMKRCFELAKQGLGTASPNPIVGCVIVYNDTIIGEGYHQKCGEAHAEVNAINSVKDKSLLPKSTLYVSLEPCAHKGRTPACSLLIIEKKIPNVVVSCIDTFSKVSGKGIEMLKNAGVNVTLGILKDEGKYINRRFFTFHKHKRPYIILKWAETIDGFIDIDRKNPLHKPEWITNEISRTLVHKWRTEESAIMVGTDTAKLDNPKLNVRNWRGNNPLRITIDKDLRLPDNLFLFDKSQKTIVFTAKNKKSDKNLDFIKIDFNKNVIQQILNYLYKIDIQSIIVEGGEKLLNSFISQNIWDEARIFVGDKHFFSGVKAPKINGKIISKDFLEESVLYVFKNTIS